MTNAKGKHMSAIQIALGAAVGAVIGVVIADVSHLTDYWPHVVVALFTAGGVFLTHVMWPRK
jgi:hypothetical protein